MYKSIRDIGDKYDSIKWDFDENVLKKYKIGIYDYLCRNNENAQKLLEIRKKIDKLCENIYKHRVFWPIEQKHNIELFLEIHKAAFCEELPPNFIKGVTSRYLISEIPKNLIFDGLNKPKLRYKEIGAPKIGKDGSSRALYRHIFLDLNKKELDNLIIHELSHTMANHIMFREDDHHDDFKISEKFIKKYWPS